MIAVEEQGTKPTLVQKELQDKVNIMVVERPPAGVRVISEELVEVPKGVRWIEPDQEEIISRNTEMVEKGIDVT